MISPDVRRRIAVKLLQLYPGGYGVVSPVLQRLFAVVDPRGAVRELPPPHHFVAMWEIANQPPAPECPCASFYDPEIQGPWRLRDTDAHHPWCQFEQKSARISSEAERRATARLREGKRALSRPDEWHKIRSEIG